MFSTQALRNFRIIGIFLIVLAIYKVQSTYSYVDRAYKIPATVIENIYQVESRGPSKVYPKVELILADNKRIQIVVNTPSSEPIYEPGEHLEVIYSGKLHEETFDEVYINSWRSLYLSAGLIFSLGVGLLGLSYRLTRKQMMRIWD